MKIPARYEGVKYEEAPAEIRALFEKVRDTRRGLYIHGEVGTGKTHIAYALASNSMEANGVRSTFRNVTEFLRDIRADYDRHTIDKERPEETLLEWRGLLFLDDIGAEKVTDWVAETLYLIVNSRYNDRLPIIMTSNLPVAELAERIGERTASRIVESCDIVELKGSDRRLTNPEKITVNV